MKQITTRGALSYFRIRSTFFRHLGGSSFPVREECHVENNVLLEKDQRCKGIL